MSKNERHIEDLFRSGFEGFSVEPSPGLWGKVYSRLFWKRFFSFSLNSLNVYYLAAVLTITGAGIFLLRPAQSDQPESGNFRENSQTLNPDTPESSLPENEFTPEVRVQKDLSPLQEAKISRNQEQGFKKSADVKQADKKVKQAGPVSSDSHEIESDVMIPGPESADASSDIDEEPDQTSDARASFIASITSGCAPLAVNFTNTSMNAVSYLWSFGDGGRSSDQDPSYVFDLAGEYSVVLRISDREGTEFEQSQSIIVYATPKAQFEFDEQVNPSGDLPVYFYNYSKSAEFYLWDFGDNEESTDPEPVHYYSGPGSYNIRLVAWTANHCYDTMTVRNAFTSNENNIVFPNAFMPNPSGPSGGIYNENDINNHIFHPIISGELIEYHFKIFNRFGKLLFETSDSRIGWDGYYNDQPAAQGVYIWKARGTFSNGKSFVVSGDVTLIRKQ